MALNGSALAEGVRGGIALSLAVILLAVLGLTPSLRWIPEVPLIVAAIAVAGGISGAVGGIAYVLFGKPLLNVVVGLLLGAIGGGVIGAGGGVLGRR